MSEMRNGRTTCYPAHVACGHRAYIGRSCTVDGLPAVIVRGSDGHPYVRSLDLTRTIPFSWTAVFKVMDNHGGKFKS